MRAAASRSIWLALAMGLPSTSVTLLKRGLAGSRRSLAPRYASSGQQACGVDAEAADRTASDAESSSGIPSAASTRFRALVAYDGTEFAGWQLQPSADTIQGRLEAALATRFQAPVRVTGASRTDAGVHARGQLIHFDAPSRDDDERLQWALNNLLPPTIRIREIERAPLHPERPELLWSAIHNALGKLYVYRWQLGGVPDPLESRTRAHLVSTERTPFDLDRVRIAARALVGSHDWTSFTNLAVSGASPVARARAAELAARDKTRTIHSLDVVDEGSGRVALEFRLDGALYKMVRNVVGTLAAVGYGRVAPEAMPLLLARRDRSRMPAPAAACGLTLERVWFSDLPTAKPLALLDAVSDLADVGTSVSEEESGIRQTDWDTSAGR